MLAQQLWGSSVKIIEQSYQLVRSTQSLGGHDIITLSASLKDLTCQNVRTDLVLIGHLLF